ncbi:Ubiquitin carboxyl-terminal hydrolase family protein [Euphorbia peplus]|nr:Ubiquitin carboxyl-terminal hydrolase family protein [Euphorbia peplus]
MMILLENLRPRLVVNHGILSNLPSTSSSKFTFGPFNSFIQKRWKKPADTAQTRLENRTRDSKLDKLATDLKKLKIIRQIYELMSRRKRGPFVSVQLMSRWKNIVGLNVTMGEFVHKYPHIFEVFVHPHRRNLCCRISSKMRGLINEEESAIRVSELDSVRRVKKLLMMSKNGRLHVHALRLIRKELGLPEDFRDSILSKYKDDFRLVDLEIVELVEPEEKLSVAEIEEWREREYREKWLSEFETKYAFPINFPTGFKIEGGYRLKLKNWQRLPYSKPYESNVTVKKHTHGGVDRYEKRMVAIIHELLSLTVEKMVEVERLSHFKKDLGMDVNARELLLQHPGIFYISTKGSCHTVFLREAYAKGCMVEPNLVSSMRRKLLDLIVLGCRNTRELSRKVEVEEGSRGRVTNGGKRKADGDWVIPMLENMKAEDE